jgi:glycosyltransferase involved in cell wall biosynthesis
MQLLIECLFWCSLCCVLYPYLGYPLLLLMLPRRRPVCSEAVSLHEVAVIIAVHNEQRNIEAKILNTLAIDYPHEKLQIVVVSDCSDDATVAIAKRFETRGIRVVESGERLGKEHAQRLGLEATSAAIVIFTDAATSVLPDCAQRFSGYFADPLIGAVSSEDRLSRVDGKLAAEGLYLAYELFVRRLEAGVLSLVGLTGPLFAVRRELCSPWIDEGPSDFRLALEAIKRGCTCVSASDIPSHYLDLADERREYQRKYRTVLRGITCLWRYRAMLNPLRYPFASFLIFSHKVARWSVSLLLVVLLLSNLQLATYKSPFQYFLGLQLLVYGSALSTIAIPHLRCISLFRFAAYFLLTNAAVVHAILSFVAGKRLSSWAPSHRR